MSNVLNLGKLLFPQAWQDSKTRYKHVKLRNFEAICRKGMHRIEHTIALLNVCLS